MNDNDLMVADFRIMIRRLDEYVSFITHEMKPNLLKTCDALARNDQVELRLLAQEAKAMSARFGEFRSLLPPSKVH